MEYPGVQKMIDLLGKVDDSAEAEMGFDMEKFYESRKETKHPCGTACCIDGWAEWALRQEAKEAFTEDPLRDSFGQFCEMPPGRYSISAAIILPAPFIDFYDRRKGMKDITRPVAIRALEILRDTGRVFWQRAYDEVVHGIIYGTTADGDPFYERKLDGKQVLIQRNRLQEWVCYFEQRVVTNVGQQQSLAMSWFKRYKGE